MLGAEAREANRAWLMQQVNGVLEPLMNAIVREKPENAIKFMVEQMEKDYGEQALNGDKQKVKELADKIALMEQKLEAQRA